MEIRDVIAQISSGWAAYRDKEHVDKDDPVSVLVTSHFPDAIRAHLAAYDMLVVKGSTGQGNITVAPWIALFDRRLTTSATTGYYVVYLFSTDMSTVTLCLAFGTTQFEAQFGGPRLAFPRMRVAATRLQEMFNHVIPANLARGPIDLGANPRQEIHFAYQQSAILSFAPYRLDALPDEAKLAADLLEITKLYSAMVSDALDPTMDRLVEAVVEPADHVESIEVHDFVPRPPRKGSTSSGSRGRTRRYSPQSRKVGDAGERAVIAYERERLVKIGRQDC